MTQPDRPPESTGRGAWTEPGAYAVAAGVTRIPLPLPMDGLRAVNVYLIEGAQGLTLIDGGWAIPESRAVFEDSLRQAGYGLGDIRQFLVTHMHRDHYTQAYVLGQELGVDVTLGIGDKPTLDLMHEERLTEDPNLARLRLAGADELFAHWRSFVRGDPALMATYGYPDRWLESDTTLEIDGRLIQAVHTPGHTQGHFVYADVAAGLLFAGDHVLPTITPSIGFEPAWVQQPLLDFMDSLVKVRALPDLEVLPAHGPIAPSSYARVDELLAHHETRLDQCAAAVRDGAQSAWGVAGELPWTRHARRLDELGPFDQVLAAFETLAHLELLHHRAVVERSETDGRALFTAR